MKIMKIGVCDSLTIAFKRVGKDINITKDETYLQGCIGINLASLLSIPDLR